MICWVQGSALLQQDHSAHSNVQLKRDSNVTNIMKTSIILILTIVLNFTGSAKASAQNCGSCSAWSGSTVSMTIHNPNGTQTQINNIPFLSGMNVAVAMLNASCVDPSFTFKAQSYCPYGQYVTSVNGWYESSNYYWSLSVNGTVSSTGIDFTVLKAGDSISWSVQKIVVDNNTKQRESSHQEKLRLLHHARKLAAVMKE